MGVTSVSVYTSVDANTPHVHEADENVCLGEDSRAYLDANLLLEMALKHGCDAIHPGYGFISESHYAAKMSVLAIMFITITITIILLSFPDLKTLALSGLAQVPSRLSNLV